MAQSSASERRLRHEGVLPDHRHNSLGAQDLRLASELLQAAGQDHGLLRYETRELRVLAEATKTTCVRCRICIATSESVRAASSSSSGQTDLDDGRRRADRLVPGR